jgi:hypothetical protein
MDSCTVQTLVWIIVWTTVGWDIVRVVRGVVRTTVHTLRKLTMYVYLDSSRKLDYGYTVCMLLYNYCIVSCCNVLHHILF